MTERRHVESAEVQRRVDEQAALRRVATLVAREASRAEVFAAIAEEVRLLLGTEETRLLRYQDADSAIVTAALGPDAALMPIGARVALDDDCAAARVSRTARPVREDAATGTVVAAPIVVEGSLWGTLIAATTRHEPPRPETEAQLAQFAELMATAIANAESRERARQLGEEQTALRRMATLVARGVAPEEVFRAVAGEVSVLFGSDVSAIVRFEDDATVTVLGDVGGPHEPGARVTLDPGYVVHTVHETSRSARFDTDDPQGPHAGSLVRSLGVRSAVASPIVVEGELWGAITVASLHGPLSATAERRLTEFTELVATAIANAGAREELSRLAEEQAALRRVAELVAREAPQAEVFSATADEIGGRLGELRMVRYGADDRAVVVACSDGARPDTLPVGARLPPGELADALRSSGLRSVVATPIVVSGRPWGAMLAGTLGAEPMPADSERRLGQFAELTATAIANAEARAEIQRLADEQAALRRVATLVAEGASPRALFDAVTVEIERLLGADSVSLARYEPDGQVTTLVDRDPDSGACVSVGAPIVVQGRLWGVATANWTGEQSPPAETEERMAQFAQLLETAIANADSLDQLMASRARLVTAGDAARRRVVRDLHDGAQQRLVHTVITLKLARQELRASSGDVESLLAKALEYAEQGNAELRALAQGILPAALTSGGVGAGVEALVERLDLPVRVDVPAERFEPEIEASAYFIVAEALTNVVKHARATAAEVTARAADGMLHIEVQDDGVGGADRDGHGLVGLADRATALGGWLEVESRATGGTRVAAVLPLGRG